MPIVLELLKQLHEDNATLMKQMHAENVLLAKGIYLGRMETMLGISMLWTLGSGLFLNQNLEKRRKLRYTEDYVQLYVGYGCVSLGVLGTVYFGLKSMNM